LVTTLPGYRANPLGEAPIEGLESPAARKAAGRLAKVMLGPTATPRLREYFPETLVWQPALETDRAGNAELRFKLADNITTWRIDVIASTLDGKVARTESELLAYQPFFLEHDPPRRLTEGDTIALPVIVRSYLDEDQSVDVAMKPEPWFSPTGTVEHKTQMKAGESATATFGFKATTPVKDGKQRVTAIGTAASDRIEKPVTVLPNGREMVETQSRILRGNTSFDFHVPTTALNGSARGEIKIYPNLAAHIADAIDGILERPHGCAEQVISSTYPSLLLLRVEKKAGLASPLSARARKYLADGYARLLAYQSKDGGFTYWGNGDSDIALTAYAVQFLSDAKDFTSISEPVIQRAANWLASKQREDGSWEGALTTTTLVAHALANSGLTNVQDSRKRDTLRAALTYLRAHMDQSKEPYALALFAMIAKEVDRDVAVDALRRLEGLAQAAGNASYWDLTSNSPFYGWGLPGRLESSALSIRALSEGIGWGIRTENTQSLIDRGLAFLLANKDRYGVWYSTQATMRSLDTLSRLADSFGQGNGQIELKIGGARVQTVPLPRDRAAITPITLDISKFVRPGDNRIELAGSAGAATVQVTNIYYIPWTVSPDRKGATAETLRLDVRFDKTEGRIGDTFTCNVTATRTASSGYGMLLAEIGLPPGVDVDRASLERAIANSGVFRYEIQPDRIVAYLWPRGNSGSKFEFKFRSRYGIDAQTAPSVVYEYYNPDDRAIQAPTHFVTR
jgi:uncharacterized protein YfaS (alpha-2-macroglobulin family)